MRTSICTLIQARQSPRRLLRHTGAELFYCHLVFAVAMSVAAPQHADAAVYRCTNGVDPVLFSQFGCPETSESSQWTGNETSIIAIPALTANEKAELDAMARAADKRSRDHRRQLRHRQKRRAAAVAQADTQCREALTALEDIHLQKRQGYPARTARLLDRNQSRWESVRKANC